MIKIYLLILLFLISCDTNESISYDIDCYNDLQTQLIMAESGDVITIPNSKLYLNVK